MIRLALVGCGAWGRHYVTSAREAGNCLVTHAASSDRSDDALAGVERVESREWRALLDAPVDAFVVAAPPRAREEICVELLERGRPVMVEKPLALALSSALAISRAALASGAPLLVAHQHLFAPAYEELRARSSGWTHAVVVSSAGSDGPRRDYSALWDYGPHDVAMFLGLTSIRCVPKVRADKRGAGSYRLLLETPDRTGHVRVWNDAAPKRRVLTILSDAEMLVYDDLDPEGVRLRHNERAVRISSARPLTRALEAFANAATSGTRDWRFDPFLGVEVTRVLGQAEMTAEERHDADDDHD